MLSAFMSADTQQPALGTGAHRTYCAYQAHGHTGHTGHIGYMGHPGLTHLTFVMLNHVMSSAWPHSDSTSVCIATPLGSTWDMTLGDTGARCSLDTPHKCSLSHALPMMPMANSKHCFDPDNEAGI